MTRSHIPIGSDAELEELIQQFGGGSGLAFGSAIVGPDDTSLIVEAVSTGDGAAIDLKRTGDSTVGEIVIEEGVTLYELVGGEHHSISVSGGKLEIAKVGAGPGFTYTPIFRVVFADGSIHIPTGASLVADL